MIVQVVKHPESQVNIISYSIAKPSNPTKRNYIVYTIRLRTLNDSSPPLFIQKRFSDFLRLHHRLSSAYPEFEFQSSVFQRGYHAYSKRFDPHFLNYRKCVLEQFLIIVEKHKDAIYHPAMSEFLISQ